MKVVLSVSVGTGGPEGLRGEEGLGAVHGASACEPDGTLGSSKLSASFPESSS